MTKSRQSFLIYALLLFAIALSVYQGARLVESNRFKQLQDIGKTRTGLYAKSLKDSLEKYRPIPYLLSRDTRVRGLLEKHLQPIKLNPHLEDFAHAGKTLIYVLDSEGTTVASSNWRATESLVGHNFAFRPYFMDAKDHRSGSYYAIGQRTGKPGFFISYPVLKGGDFLGVVVVKVNLEQLQETWKESGETIIVSDAFGILFLSSRPEWKYRSLRPLSVKTSEWLQSIQYPGQSLLALNVDRQAGQVGADGNILQIDSVSFLEQSEQLLDYGWRIHYLSNMEPVSSSFQIAILLGSGIALSIFLTSLYIRERRQRHRTRREAREAKAIKQLNELLKAEIAEHKETEWHLEKTQEELIQAGKLAALGRMSAAIAHELNQPVTAIRTFLASSMILIDRNRIDELGGNLQMISGLTDRMMAVTGQLKTFARKGHSPKDSVNLYKVIQSVLHFFAAQLNESRVSVHSSAHPSENLVVCGDSMQLEQVISNLLRNAIDALNELSSDEHSTEKMVQFLLAREGNSVVLTIRDNGPGMSEETLDSLFEPFFTTKEIGKGLGLGLSISYGIINQMGGTITAENHGQGGALFTLRLPLIEVAE